MKIRINAKIISKLNPLRDRFDNFKLHYEFFDSDIGEFLGSTDFVQSIGRELHKESV